MSTTQDNKVYNIIENLAGDKPGERVLYVCPDDPVEGDVWMKPYEDGVVMLASNKAYWDAAKSAGVKEWYGETFEEWESRIKKGIDDLQAKEKKAKIKELEKEIEKLRSKEEKKKDLEKQLKELQG